MLKSAYTILIEQYALVEESMHKLSKSMELSSTPLSPLQIAELQSKDSSKRSRSKLDDLIDKAINGIFSDYKSQFGGEG